MSKTFRPWLIDQPQLLPPSVQEFVPAGHVAHFIREMVREDLDLSAILDTYGELRGYPPFDPRMMTALLLYGYSRGVYSSRRLYRPQHPQAGRSRSGGLTPQRTPCCPTGRVTAMEEGGGPLALRRIAKGRAPWHGRGQTRGCLTSVKPEIL